MSAPNLFHKLAAETIGTVWLVVGGVGSAVFSLKAQSDLFSLGIGYLGVALAFGKPGFIATGHMAANGYGTHSPTGYSLGAVILAEIVLTAVFLFVILGSTDARAPKGFAGLAIGLTLTLINLVAIPISNASVNPARSTAVAFFNGDGAPAQLWVFWLAPLVGGAIAGIAYPLLVGRAEEAPPTNNT
jgi:aquaporin Z